MMKKDTVNTHWGTMFILLVFHAGALAALFFFNWRMLWLSLAVWTIAGTLGIGIGYHRLLTHGSFKTSKLVEYLLTLCGCLALQGPHIRWVAQHRLHHETTEEKGLDPHTPLDGILHSHVGWMIFKKPDLQSQELLVKYAPRLLQDRFHLLTNQFYWVPISWLAVILLWKFGIAGLLWGVFMPVFVLWHFTWSVNSVCHKWGSRRFDTRDNSRNVWWLSLPTFGESWHANHHRWPWSARHGLVWYEIDVNWYVIRLMKSLGLVWKVMEP